MEDGQTALLNNGGLWSDGDGVILAVQLVIVETQDDKFGEIPQLRWNWAWELKSDKGVKQKHQSGHASVACLIDIATNSEVIPDMGENSPL